MQLNIIEFIIISIYITNINDKNLIFYIYIIISKVLKKYYIYINNYNLLKYT